MYKQMIVGLGTLLLAVLAGPAQAQQASVPQIEQVHVGLPAGSGDKESGRVRPGAWALSTSRSRPARPATSAMSSAS